MASPELWSQLSTAALLGTERANSWPALDGPLAALLQTRPQTNPQDNFLTSAAAFDLYHRVGMLPVSIETSPDVAKPEERPLINAAADGHLSRLLAGHFEGVLPEWLDLCARSGKRVWERHIPALLDIAARDEALQPFIQQVIGHRGQWLAAQNPDWQPTVTNTTDPAALWDTGKRTQRVAVLRDTRRREPAFARQMLEKVWSQEPPDERAAFLAVLLDNLTMGDEPFLESALDDKRKEVRSLAADLLARLPESRLSLRMIERVRKLVAFETSSRGKIMKALAGVGKTKLLVTLPEEKTKDLERDGVSGKPAVRGLGDKAWTLAMIIGSVPPGVWEGSNSERSPQDILALSAGHEFAGALWIGWSIAASRHRNASWAQTLINHWLSASKKESIDSRPIIADLLNSLTPEAREGIAADALDMDWNTLEDDIRFEMLQTCTHPWSLPFSRTVLTALRRHVAHQKNVYQYLVRQAMENEFARRFHPQIAPEIAANWPKDAPEPFLRAVETMIATVQFRHDIQKELIT